MRPSALRVLRQVERQLVEKGERGEALSGEFAGLHRLRVGDYRVIYARTDEGFLVLRIGPIARLIGVGGRTAIERLAEEGVIRRAETRAQRATPRKRIRTGGSVSELVKDQRR